MVILLEWTIRIQKFTKSELALIIFVIMVESTNGTIGQIWKKQIHQFGIQITQIKYLELTVVHFLHY